jgi:hypothetical protein
MPVPDPNDPVFQPTPSAPFGAFRVICGFSHFLFDDPIMFPGQAGKSHLHMFFGNTGTNAYSTSASLQTSGTSTCAGGTLDRTGYWVPAIINNVTHNPVPASFVNVYYKAGYSGVPAAITQPIPPGLVIMAGSAANTKPGVNPVSWTCLTADGGLWQVSIPTICPASAEVVEEIDFPYCWDGVNLDSPDHMSHLTYATDPIGCPADHPVALPNLAYEIHWPVTYDNESANWQLSSDNYDVSGGNAGYSGHGDYMDGWDIPTMQIFIEYCDRAEYDCADYLLGNGTMLY